MVTHACSRGLLAVVLGVLTASGVWAGVLLDDPNAYTDGGGTTWQGRVEFRGETMGLWWAADVEYAVYAPAGYPGDSFAESWPAALDPSNGEHFIYAYQIFNDLGIDLEYPYPSIPPPAFAFDKEKEHVTTLTVGINGGDEQAANEGYIAGTGDKSPVLDEINHSSVLWEFIGGVGGANQINYGDIGDVILFSSPYGPEWDSATLSGEVPDTETLPSPIPEPATLGLLTVGAVVLWNLRSRKRLVRF